MEYKLEDFGLKKASLKRKINKLKNNKDTINKLLNKNGTKYTLVDIKTIVDILYKNDKPNMNEPLSIYYSKQNKKKYKDLVDLIEIKEKNNFSEKLEQELTVLHEENLELFIDRKILENRFSEISKKYSILKENVIKEFLKIENKWIKKIRS